MRVLRRAVARTQQIDQFALCGEQLRAVKLHQHLIFFNKLAWSIDAEFLHVGGRSRDDAPDSLCFRHDATNRTDAVTERFHFDTAKLTPICCCRSTGTTNSCDGDEVTLLLSVGFPASIAAWSC